MANTKIILADDHSLFRKGLKSLIQGIDSMQVIAEAGNGQELLNLLDEPGNIPDIILMDLNMPVITGIEATEKIQAKYPEIKIIVLSIHTDEQFVVQLIQKGASGYLFKNAEPEEVEQAIKDVAETGFYFNEKVLSAIRKGVVLKQNPLHFNRSAIELSPREIDVLKLICKEMAAPDIAQELFISTRTVNGHRQNLLDKTGANNTAGLVIFAIKNHFVDIGF